MKTVFFKDIRKGDHFISNRFDKVRPGRKFIVSKKSIGPKRVFMWTKSESFENGGGCVDLDFTMREINHCLIRINNPE